MSDLTREKLRKGFIQEVTSAQNLRDEIMKHISEFQVMNINQRRDLLKHITSISAIILGLLPFALSYSVANVELVQIGAIGHLLVIVFVIFYLRWLFDKESKGLDKQKREHLEPLQHKIDLVTEKYLPQATDESKDPNSVLQLYMKELADSPVIKKVTDRLKEPSSKKLDWFADLITILFAVSAATLFFGII